MNISRDDLLVSEGQRPTIVLELLTQENPFQPVCHENCRYSVFSSSGAMRLFDDCLGYLCPSTESQNMCPCLAVFGC